MKQVALKSNLIAFCINRECSVHFFFKYTLFLLKIIFIGKITRRKNFKSKECRCCAICSSCVHNLSCCNWSFSICMWVTAITVLIYLKKKSLYIHEQEGTTRSKYKYIVVKNIGHFCWGLQNLQLPCQLCAGRSQGSVKKLFPWNPCHESPHSQGFSCVCMMDPGSNPDVA